MARLRVANRVAPNGAGLEIETTPATSLLNAMLREGVRVRHDCGGKAECGTCRIRIVSGEQGLSPMRDREAARLASLGPETAGLRLACQTRSARDAEIELIL